MFSFVHSVKKEHEILYKNPNKTDYTHLSTRLLLFQDVGGFIPLHSNHHLRAAVMCLSYSFDSSVVRQKLESNSKEMQSCYSLIAFKRSGNLFIALLYTLEALDQSPLTLHFAFGLFCIITFC